MGQRQGCERLQLAMLALVLQFIATRLEPVARLGLAARQEEAERGQVRLVVATAMVEVSSCRLAKLVTKGLLIHQLGLDMECIEEQSLATVGEVRVEDGDCGSSDGCSFLIDARSCCCVACLEVLD